MSSTALRAPRTRLAPPGLEHALDRLGIAGQRVGRRQCRRDKSGQEPSPLGVAPAQGGAVHHLLHLRRPSEIRLHETVVGRILTPGRVTEAPIPAFRGDLRGSAGDTRQLTRVNRATPRAVSPCRTARKPDAASACSRTAPIGSLPSATSTARWVSSRSAVRLISRGRPAGLCRHPAGLAGEDAASNV